MNIKFKNKLIASSIHLIVSAIALSLFLIVIFFIWFPNNLFLAGASRGLSILILVDIVLGPLLTFVVYNKHKKSLKFDLSCIVALQIGCFIYGAQLIYQERPILQLLAEDGINLITLREVNEFEMDTTYSFLSSPQYTLLKTEGDISQFVINKVTYEVTRGKPYNSKTDLHINMKQVSKEVFSERVTFIRNNLTQQQLNNLDLLADQHPKKDCEWLPLISYHVEGYTCVDHNVGITDFKEM